MPEVFFTRHARQRIAQRDIKMSVARKIVMNMCEILSPQKLEIASNGYRIVAKLQDGRPTVITAWNLCAEGYHQKQKSIRKHIKSNRRMTGTRR